MESQKTICDVSDSCNSKVLDYIKKRVTPIFNKALKETPKNPMSVGGVGSDDSKYLLYNPHNYRAYIDFDRSNINPDSFINTEVQGSVHYKVQNSKELVFDFVQGCRITIKKYQVEINIKSSDWCMVELNKGGVDKFFKIHIENYKKCVNALKFLMSSIGGKSNFHLLNISSEEKFKNDDSIDLIPIKQRFHGELVKKVYNESNVEFKSPAFALNYLHNRAIENITPEIVREFNNLYHFIEIKFNGLEFLKKNIIVFEDLFQFPKEVSCLPMRDKKFLSDWLFERFGQ